MKEHLDKIINLVEKDAKKLFQEITEPSLFSKIQIPLIGLSLASKTVGYLFSSLTESKINTKYILSINYIEKSKHYIEKILLLHNKKDFLNSVISFVDIFKKDITNNIEKNANIFWLELKKDKNLILNAEQILKFMLLNNHHNLDNEQIKTLLERKNDDLLNSIVILFDFLKNENMIDIDNNYLAMNYSLIIMMNKFLSNESFLKILNNEKEIKVLDFLNIYEIYLNKLENSFKFKNTSNDLIAFILLNKENAQNIKNEYVLNKKISYITEEENKNLFIKLILKENLLSLQKEINNKNLKNSLRLLDELDVKSINSVLLEDLQNGYKEILETFLLLNKLKKDSEKETLILILDEKIKIFNNVLISFIEIEQEKIKTNLEIKRKI